VRSKIYPLPNSGGTYNANATTDSETGAMTSDTKVRADADTKLSEMNNFGIDTAIVTATMLLSLNTTTNPQVGVAYAHAYNEFVRNEVLNRHEGIKGAALVSRFEPDKGAEEIDDMAQEDDVVAVFIPNAGLNPPFGDTKYDPIYQAAQDNDLPILLHPSSSSFGIDFPMSYQFSHTYSEARIVSQPWRCMWDLTTSLTRGLPERFPDLDIVIQEAGIAWIPYMLWRIDDTYLEHPADMPLLDKLPSKYIEDRYYFSTQPLGHTTGANLATAIKLLGPESVMFSSDLPHGAFDSPPEILKLLKPHFDEDTLRAIMGETARDVFGLKGN
jgi:predicted TIM-barrel fold metal-dependent hydrolase